MSICSMKVFTTHQIGYLTLLIPMLCNIKISESLILKFTKLECFEFDRPFADFKKCYLKALARDKISLNIHTRLHQVPVTNVSINAELFRKGSSQRYQPFMYNTTLDFCWFLKNQNRLLFWKIIYQIIKTKSNLNHTCPFDHDLIVENLVLDGSMLKQIPFPSEDFMIKLKVAAYNHYKAEVRVYGLIKE